jgi:hypothetical protein
MPRKLQGWAEAKRHDSDGVDDRLMGALPKLMGEQGRDSLRQYISDSAFAQDIMQSIDRDGYCVLPGVLSAAEADRELDRAWGFVERASPTVNRSDWNTWWTSGGPDPWPCSQRDMLQLHQAGWVFSDLRETIAERVFEELYGTKELHVSKDGFTFQRPTYGDLGRTPNDHFDQGQRWMGLQCIQGSVALTDQSENDGCFKVWPGSHEHREEILSSHRHTKARRSDFIILSPDEHDTLRGHGIQPRRVPVKRGDVILWRSDVCHCGAPPIDQCDTCRVVAYVCCLPAVLTPEPVYKQKQRAYERLETGCHYPNREEWFEATDKHLRVSWRAYFTEPPQLTLRQRQLYGLERYTSKESSAVASGSSPTQTGERQNSAIVRGSAASSLGVHGPVPGLELWCASAATTRDALLELRPHFEIGKNRSSSDAFEVGWSFHAVEQKQVMRMAKSLEDFPCLRALVAEVMQALTNGTKSLGEETLNIICRRYSRGQSLPKHLDRPEMFDEDVYGCILHNTSDQCLSFDQRGSSGKLVGHPHLVDEKPGCCFRARGPARYEWVHGVEELSHGERISITWRWIQEGVASEGHEMAKALGPKGKGKRQGKALRKKAEGKGKGEQLATHECEGQGETESSRKGDEKAAVSREAAAGLATLDAVPQQARVKRWARNK